MLCVYHNWSFFKNIYNKNEVPQLLMFSSSKFYHFFDKTMGILFPRVISNNFVKILESIYMNKVGGKKYAHIRYNSISKFQILLIWLTNNNSRFF